MITEQWLSEFRKSLPYPTRLRPKLLGIVFPAEEATVIQNLTRPVYIIHSDLMGIKVRFSNIDRLEIEYDEEPFGNSFVNLYPNAFGLSPFNYTSAPMLTGLTSFTRASGDINQPANIYLQTFEIVPLTE